MKNYILNVGLNVGLIEPLIQLDSTMYHLIEVLGTDWTHEVIENIGGDWCKERTVVVEGSTQLDYIRFKELLKELSARLSQDGIAFKFDGYGDIAYNKEYRGEFYDFNESYFID